MKTTQPRNIFMMILIAFSSIQVREYSSFLSGLMLGLSLIMLVKICYDAIRSKKSTN